MRSATISALGFQVRCTDSEASQAVAEVFSGRQGSGRCFFEAGDEPWPDLPREVRWELELGPRAHWGEPIPYDFRFHGDLGRYTSESDLWRCEVSWPHEGEPAEVRTRLTRPAQQPDPVAAWRWAFRSALRAVSALLLPSAQSLLVHGCAMVAPGAPREAILFVGPSGAGKSTMADRLPGWRCLADDTLVVGFDSAGEPWVCGSVFPGKERRLCWGQPHRLGELFFLEPGAPNLSLEPLDEAEALSRLTRAVFFPASGGPAGAQVINLAHRLVLALRSRTLRSNLGHDVAAALEGLP